MKNKKSNQGYTLVEIMVTVVLFSLIFGIISSLFAFALKSQRRSLISQELLSQSSYAMEYISRHARTAQKQQGIFSPGECLPNNTSSYQVIGGDTLRFVGNEIDPCCWEVSVDSGRLKRKLTLCAADDPTGSYLTSGDMTVEDFNVNLSDADDEQPRLTLFLQLKGSGGEKEEEQPVIKIQNSISQRNLNVD